MKRSKSHYDGRRFRNLVPRRHGFLDLLRWMLSREQGKWPDWIDAPSGPAPPRSSERLRVTFVNHTTFLLQLDGVNILTDPIWSKRASPVAWAGPRRRRPPGIRFEDLPPIHLVLLSHDHYDHMDIPTLKRLAREHSPVIYTGLKNTRTLAANRIGNVIELDWWDKVHVGRGGLRLTCVPAQHFSGRYPYNRDQTLWCGFVIKGRGGVICFAADTGMGAHFAAIARKFPAIDLAILPIGAFRPRWFMSEVHMSPEQALDAHRILRARVSVASHFGTFPLADDGAEEPVQRLEKALGKADQKGTDFWVLGFGEGRVVPPAVTSHRSQVDRTGVAVVPAPKRSS